MVTYPEDWKEYKITEIAKTFIGLVTTMTTNYSSSGVNLIRNQDIEDNKIVFKDKIYLNEEFAQKNKSRMHLLNDIVTVHTGDIGTSAVIDEHLTGSLGFATIVTRLKREKADPWFVSWYYNSHYYKEYIYSIMTGDGRNNLNMKDFNKAIICLPSVSEQQEIAKTLFCFNEYIDDLMELIEKKKSIRDGALEDLMNTRTRISGFNQEWETYKFIHYFTLLPTNTCSRDQLSYRGDVGDVHYGDILIKYRNVLSDFDEIPRLNDSSKISVKSYLQKHDILIADTAEDETVGKVVQVGDVSIRLVGGLHTVACRPNYETADGFLGYYMNSSHYQNQLYPYITGIKVSSVSKKSFGETELRIPSDIKEQRAIVAVLTTMDEEIEALEIEREKMIQIREGAIDDLLTGRVRLTV